MKNFLHNKSQNGVTLLEVVIYLGLFTLIIGGAVISIANIIHNTQQTNSKIAAQEEGNFLLSKISWALNGATSFSVTGTSVSIQNLGTTLLFAYDADDLTLKRGTASPTILNNQAVSIDSALFTKTSGPPDELHVTLTVDGLQFQLNQTLR